MYQTSIRNKKKHSNFQKNKESNYILDPLNEEYAFVIKMLGNCRVQLISQSGNKAIGVIRGSLRKFNKRILIEKGDIVVVSNRDFQLGKVDIVHKFNCEQTQGLIKNGSINIFLSNFYNNKKNINDENDLTFSIDNLQFDDNIEVDVLEEPNDDDSTFIVIDKDIDIEDI